MPDASFLGGVGAAVVGIVLTVARIRRNRAQGMSVGRSVHRSMWHDRMLNRDDRNRQ